MKRERQRKKRRRVKLKIMGKITRSKKLGTKIRSRVEESGRKCGKGGRCE